MPTLSDHTRVPARVLELLAGVTGHQLSLRTASDAAAIRRVAGEGWASATAHAARQAGLKAASFTVQSLDEVARLGKLGCPALTRVRDRWLVLLGAHGDKFDLVVVDDLGEERRSMRPAALWRWLAAHDSPIPQKWLAIEPRMMLAATSHAPTEVIRLIRHVLLEKHEIAVVIVYGVTIAVVSLAVPIGVQALVTTIAANALVQPILMLALLILIALTGVGVLRVLQILVAERIHRRLWVRGVTDWLRRTPRTSRESRQASSNHELCNRFLDTCILQKDVVSWLLDGSSLILVTAASLVLLAFYHPLLLLFDLALIVGIALVVISGLGATQRAIAESNAKWELFAWMDDVAGGRLIFADPGGRAFSDARGELLLRRWLQARGDYFHTILRQICSGIGLEAISIVALLALGGWLVISRELSLGQLVAASVLVSTIGSGVGRLGRQLDPMFEAVAAVATLGKTLDAPLEPTGGELLPATDRPMAVELRQRATGHLLGVLAPGDRLGLIGGTDDHSRLLDLLYGLYGRDRLTTLSARLDDLETDILELDSLREQVALVRGGEVVWASVIENLVGTGLVEERGDLFHLLDLVALRQRLIDLPNGLDSELISDGDGGPLTDSEIRRLVLVRALLTRPRLLLIDLGLDRLGLTAAQRAALLDWIFDRARPWTLIVVTDSCDSSDLLGRCDRQLQLAN